MNDRKKYLIFYNHFKELLELTENKSFHGILLDTLFGLNENTSNVCKNDRKRIWNLIEEGIHSGVVKPLTKTVFPIDKCEEAFRFMSSGKHIGKVVIEIRSEEIDPNSHFNRIQLKAIPRTVFYPNKIYIITGGLGGMGLELIDWMIERGAKMFFGHYKNGSQKLVSIEKIEIF